MKSSFQQVQTVEGNTDSDSLEWPPGPAQKCFFHPEKSSAANFQAGRDLPEKLVKLRNSQVAADFSPQEIIDF
jgi:hypothetical protein